MVLESGLGPSSEGSHTSQLNPSPDPLLPPPARSHPSLFPSFCPCFSPRPLSALDVGRAGSPASLGDSDGLILMLPSAGAFLSLCRYTPHTP